jgi:hypothetical protein
MRLEWLMLRLRYLRASCWQATHFHPEYLDQQPVPTPAAIRVRKADGSIKPGARAPGSRTKKIFEPAKRVTAHDAKRCRPLSRALPSYYFVILGLAPQALCFRPLRGLVTFGCKTSRDGGGLIFRKRQIADRNCELINGKGKFLSRVREFRLGFAISPSRVYENRIENRKSTDRNSQIREAV